MPSREEAIETSGAIHWLISLAPRTLVRMSGGNNKMNPNMIRTYIDRQRVCPQCRQVVSEELILRLHCVHARSPTSTLFPHLGQLSVGNSSEDPRNPHEVH